MFDNKYPYTDYHELNLDWFMGEFKKLVAEWEETKGDWNSLHDFVQNYFDNLNVQNEIDNKINAMIADGSFATIVTPLVEAALPTIVDGKLPAVVASQISAVVATQIDAVVAGQLPAVAAAAAAEEVGTWLAAHIDPDTGYVIDNTLTVSQAAADAKTVGDNIDELKSTLNANLISCANNDKLIFPSTFRFGTLDTDGQIEVPSTNRRIVTENYIKLNYNTTIYVDAGFSAIYCVYNNDLSLASRSIKNGATSFDVPSGTIFRVCILKNGTEVVITSVSEYIDKAYLESTNLGSTVAKHENEIDLAEANIVTLQNKTSDILNVLENFASITLNEGGDGFIRTSGNVDLVSGFKYYTFPVSVGETYRITSYTGSAARLWLVEDSNNNVIDYSIDSSAPSAKTEIVTIAPGGMTLIVNNYYDPQGLFILSAEKKELGNITSLYSPLYGKVYCAVGDSITYGEDMDAEGIVQTSDIEVHQWSGVNARWNDVTSNFRKSYAYQIAERNNMIFWNGGVSGSTMQGIEERRGFSLENGRYTKLPDHIDYLTIFFGWNDAAYGTLGTINDNTNDTFYGGYNVVLPYLINKYPYAKIALIVPFGTDAGHRDAVRQLGDKWGLAVWDNYQGGTPLYYGKEDSVGVNASIVTANRAKFQANGAHPNYKGHTQLADMLEHFMQGI